MSKNKLKVWRVSDDAVLPVRATPGSVGYDVYSTKEYEFEDGDYHIISTDLIASVPKGYYLELMLRSSLSKRGLSLANNVGVIDEDYKGEGDIICALVCKSHNGKKDIVKTRGYGVSTKISAPVKIEKGERIAQLIIRKSYIFDIEDMTGQPFEGETREGIGSTGRK